MDAINRKAEPSGPILRHDRPHEDRAWDVLHHFAQELKAQPRTSQQIHLFLETVRESLRADVVYWYAAASNEVADVVGRQDAAPSWCLEFARKLLRGTPETTGEVLRSNVAVAANGGSAPRSVAMLRVSQSQPAWVVALSLSGDRVFQAIDLKIMKLAKRILLNHRQDVRVYERLKDTLLGFVRCFTTAIEAKDPYTCGHSERVARIAVRLGQEMGLPQATIRDLYLGGLLHDIGKIGINHTVLLKPGPLTEEEMAHIQQHVIVGDRLMANVNLFAHLRPGVRNHHERYDGQGYPDHLVAQAIPILARILAVADACDAMMHPRPYREAFPTNQIDEVMAQGAGTQWDPDVVTHFLTCRQDLYRIAQKGIGASMVAAVESVVSTAHAGSSIEHTAFRPED